MDDVDHTLPPAWPERVRSGYRDAVALARRVMIRTHAWALNNPFERVRLRGEVDRLKSELGLLQDEIDIKDARLLQIPPLERPHYPPQQRVAILAHQAAQGWRTATVARRFHVTAATIASWRKRMNEQGEIALVQTPVPVNRYSDHVAMVVRHLKRIAPTMGKARIAQILAREGLHLAASTVERLLVRNHPPPPPPPPRAPRKAAPTPPPRPIVAKRPDHIWGVDLSVVPISGGFWVPWAPFAMLQCWPFCWWVVVVVDHFSRRAVGFHVFWKHPSAADVVHALDRIATGRSPKYIISDQGAQFQSAYRAWCAVRGITPRFGAIGKHGSIAVVERFIRSMKGEAFSGRLVPYRPDEVVAILRGYFVWYNDHRPHQTLGGVTPTERATGGVAARDERRLEPRARYPDRGAVPPRRPTAIRLEVERADGVPHLPVVRLRYAA